MSAVTATGAIIIIIVGEQNSFKQVLKEAVVVFEVFVVGVLNFFRSYKKLNLLL